MGSVGLQRHRPEQTLLYQIVERHYPAFVESLAEAGKQPPCHVRQAFGRSGWPLHHLPHRRGTADLTAHFDTVFLSIEDQIFTDRFEYE